MATTTENLGMTLPYTTDPVDVTVLNGNFSTLDAFAGAQSAKDTDQDDRLTALETSDTEQDDAIVRLVNAGAKNLAKLGFDSITASGVTITRGDDGSLTLNGTNSASGVRIVCFDLATGDTVSSTAGRWTLPPGQYFLKGTGSTSVRVQLCGHDGTDLATLSNAGADATVTIGDSWPYYVLRIWVAGSASFDGVKIWPMLCTAEDYAISDAFVPYTPTLRELYEMIQELQTGGTT